MTTFLSDIVLAGANDIQFKNASGANTGKIESDGDNLVLSNAVGDILLGDGASDVYIGDGTNSVDILFEVSGSLSAESGAVLTLGGAGGTLALGSAISSAATILGDLTVGIDDTGRDVTFFGATSGKKMLWDQSADTLIVDGTLDVNGDATVISGAGSGSLTVGRNENENMVIYVDDSNTTITGVQDSDTNAAHSFILNRTFLGSGANNFIIQKGGTAQLTLDTNSAATFAGTVTTGGDIDVPSGAALDWANGDARIVEGETSNYSLTFKTYDGSSCSAALRLDGDNTATFAGTINSGAITSTGQITGTELEGTSLDINGNADMSGVLNFSKTNVDAESSENFFRIKFKDVGGVHNDVGIGQSASNNLGFNTTAGGTFTFNDGTNGNVLTISDGQATFDGEVEAASLDINGNADISGDLTGVDTLTATTLSVTNYGLSAGDIPTLNQNTSGNAATATDATNLNATDDRDMAPEDYGYANDLRIFFSTKEGLEAGSGTGTNYQDVLYLNSYTDASGGDANVLAFDKSEKKIYHYQADQAATNWGTAKQLAYTDSDISGDTTGNAATATLSSTTTVTDHSTNNIDYPVVWHNNANALYDTASKFTFNPSTGVLTTTTLSATNYGLASGDIPNNAADTSGSAATLTEPRAINGVDFDGSAAITVTAAAGTLSGGTLNSTVVGSSLTSVGEINTGSWRGTPIAGAYIADNNINSQHYADGSIDTAHIADDQVTFAKAQGVTPNVYGNIIKLLPSDFVANDDAGTSKVGIAYKAIAGSSYGMKPNAADTELFALVSIPQGMSATHVDVFAKTNLGVIVYEAQTNANTMVSKGTGNCNTQINITDVSSTATNFLAIQVTTTATSDRVFGGQITIA